MQLLLVKTLGYVLARLPLQIGECLCVSLGNTLYYLWGSKRRLVLSNLHHVFPDRDRNWLIRAAKISFQRTIEMGYLGAIGPFLRDEQIRERYRLDESFEQLTNRYNEQAFPALILTMHFSQLESSSFLPVLRKDIPPTGVIFRPMNQKKVEAWMREVRSRGTFHLMPRREGFLRAKELLKKQQVVALFFDQNSGSSGSLDLFMGRISSNSELPDILSKIPETESYILYTERLAFCKGRISVYPLGKHREGSSVQHRAHQWLEERLLNDENACQDWLWLHKRWKTQTEARKRFRIEQRRNDLPAGELPKQFRLWLRLPADPEQLQAVLPYVSQLQQCRPDVELTLCVLASKSSALPQFTFPVYYKYLPDDYDQRKLIWQEAEWLFPDVVMTFENDKEIHREISYSRAIQRFGWHYSDEKKAPLTHSYQQKGRSASFAQTIEQMLEHFGLSVLK